MVSAQVDVPATASAAAGASAGKRRDGGVLLVRFRIDVRSAGGVLVRSLLIDAAVPPAHQGSSVIPVSVVAAWDGVATAGPAAPSGVYSCDIRLTLLRRTANPQAAAGSAAAAGVETVIGEIVQAHAGTVVLDRDSPTCALSPVSGTHLGLLTDTTFAVTWADNLTGVASSTFTATLNGVSIGSHFTVTPNGATFSPTAAQLPLLLPLFALGPNALTVTVRDVVQNPGSCSASYVVDDLHDLDGSSVGPAPVVLSLSSGGGDALIGRPPADPVIKVRAMRDGQAAPGVPLVFEFTQGHGVILDALGFGMTTDASGLAAVRVILGQEEGTQKVEARLSGAQPGSGVTVSYSAHAPGLTALPVQLPAGVPTLEDIPGSAWPSLLRVEATGLNGGPMAGAPVTFRLVDAAGQPLSNPETVGEFVPESPITGSNGRASTTFVAASTAPVGAVHVRAFVTEFPLQEVSFEGAIQDPVSLLVHVENIIPSLPPEHARLGITAGQAQVGKENGLLSYPLEVQLYRNEAPTGPFFLQGPATCPDGHQTTATAVFDTVELRVTAGEGWISATDPDSFFPVDEGPLGPITVRVTLNGAGRAAVRLHFGPKTEPHLVLSGIVLNVLMFCGFGGPGGNTASASFAAGVPELYLASVQGDGTRLRIPIALAAPQPFGGPAVLKHVVQARLPVGESISSVTLKVFDPLGAAITPESGYPEVTPEHALSMQAASNQTPTRFSLLETQPLAFDVDLTSLPGSSLESGSDPLDPGIGGGGAPGITIPPQVGPADARWVRAPTLGSIALVSALPGILPQIVTSLPVVSSVCVADPIGAMADFVWQELDAVDRGSRVFDAGTTWNVRVVIATSTPAATVTAGFTHQALNGLTGTPFSVGNGTLSLAYVPATSISRRTNLAEYRASIIPGQAQLVGLIGPPVPGHTIAILDRVNLEPDEVEHGGSNLLDSARFLVEAQSAFPTGLSVCGNATLLRRATGLIFSPNEAGGPPSARFVRSCGAISIRLSSGTTKSPLYWTQHQADWFYYSGHGAHERKQFIGLLGNPLRTQLLSGAWAGVDMFLMAGCSLVDVNDYNNNYPTPVLKTNPGIDLEASGARLICGYNYKAPNDDHHGLSGFSALIVQVFFSLRSAVLAGTAPPQQTEGTSWLGANRLAVAPVGSTVPNPDSPMNACAIERIGPTVLYHYFDFSAPDAVQEPTITSVPKNLW